ncbi:leucyl/phenylalanyl-tRNA--protein transferase [Aquabacterium sp.]|jgi:leucyl/phenylalanyl-tRNA--protein transferase|uniref:leucyl/phenylalanyl-tRNA--protein transferase n=1 Tax=Aquabacterium sp. TaxID=1872578 RepID=UPI0025C00594|nr:leucyl/phenylalanyl-tRNA--protein transferase [Aquabacterium sp.]
MIPWLESDAPFPDTAQALGENSDAPGLLAAGGELSTTRLEQAYRRGIFPWFSPGQPVLWWSTDPRMVLPVADFKLSRSLRKTIQKFRRTPGCEVRVDSAFTDVIRACANTPREGQDGTWIVSDIQKTYQQWHAQGRVHSFETWVHGRLAGGLYGVSVGRMFYGESMFARQTDASKIALAALVCFCRRHGIDVIDCQQQTAHLASLGARPWPRARFEAHLRGVIDASPPTEWSYDDSDWAALDGLA